MTSRTDPDTVVSEIEGTIIVLDGLASFGIMEVRIRTVRRRLVSLYEHWLTIQSHLPPCTELAVGIDQRSTDHPSHARFAGRPRVFVNLDLVELLRSVGYTWDQVSKALMVGRTTIWRRIRDAGITLTKYSDISDSSLDERVLQILGHHPHCGQVLIRSMLESQGVHIQRQRLRECVQRVDPEHCMSRWREPVIRRTYCVPGPNSLWHVDTHHSLIRWRCVIHGCIDGYSRLVLYLKCANNNRSDTALQLFVSATLAYGIPSRVRSDKGGENYGICEFMLQARGTERHSHIAGKSTHNQRIERLWRDVFRCVASTFHSLFYYLEDVGLLDPVNDIDLFLLHFVFLPRINHCLQEFLGGWNRHPLRTEHNWSPRKIWLNGMIDPANRGLSGVRDICEDVPNNVEYFGVDEEGPLPLDDVDRVEVPETPVPVSNTQLEELQQCVEQGDDNFGIETFVRARQLLSAMGVY